MGRLRQGCQRGYPRPLRRASDEQGSLLSQGRLMADLALPPVTTLAKPKADQLVASRFIVQRSARAAAAFLENKDRGAEAITEAIIPLLQEELEGSPAEVAEVARFLADEYVQIGDAVLVIDRETGRAIARITDEDMWQPPDVP